MRKVEKYIKEEGQSFLSAFLFPWLRIPSISQDPDNKKDIMAACGFLEEELSKSGFTVAQQNLEEGNPVVYAEKIINENLPTVLVYGHYDVQPRHDVSKWVIGEKKLSPFEPVIIDDLLYARGATDDKGQIASHLLAMRFFSKNDNFPCNIKFLIEGNEEGGGSTFYDFVRKNPNLLKSDVVLISDTGTIQDGVPAITQSLKGIMVAKVTADDPFKLIDIIHNSHDSIENRILLPDFYKGVIDFSIPDEILKIIGEPEESMGSVIRPEIGYSQLYHRLYRPTNSPLFLNYANPSPSGEGHTYKIIVHGPNTQLHSGEYGGPVQEPALIMAHLLHGLKSKGLEFEIDYLDYGSRVMSTAIHPQGKMQITVKQGNLDELIAKVTDEYEINENLIETEDAKDRSAYLKEEFEKRFDDGTPTTYLSFRLVPNQNPDEIEKSLKGYVESNKGKIEIIASADSFLTDISNKYCAAVIEGLKKGFNKDTVHLIAAGGSIPISSTLSQTLNAPVVFAGFSPLTGNLHGPNENISVPDGIYAGARSIIYSLQNIGKMK